MISFVAIFFGCAKANPYVEHQVDFIDSKTVLVLVLPRDYGIALPPKQKFCHLSR